MKILLANLLLFTGLCQILARSLPWISPTLDENDAWMDDDYDLFRLPANQPSHDFYNFMMGGNSEESKELETAVERDYESAHSGGVLGYILDSIIEIHDDADENSNENTPSKSNEQTENDDAADDQSNKFFHIVLNELFASDEDKLSAETTDVINNENKSSEEIETVKSNEDSDEVTPIVEVNIYDLTKSSEEKQDDSTAEAKSAEYQSAENSNEATEIDDLLKSSKELKTDEVANDLSQTDVNELVSFFIALELLNDMGAVIETTETKDDFTKGKEVDEILKMFASVLDGVVEEALEPKLIISAQKADDKITETTTAKNDSDEDEDSSEATTIPQNDSNEKYDDDNKSASSEEHDSNFVHFEFKAFDEDSKQQPSLEHKYSIINPQQEFMTTSAPYVPEKTPAALLTTDAQNSINEYVEIRENLNTQQDFLKEHEFDLDKDFYNIISNDLDDKSLHKFEQDIYAAQENLDRIKKNINAMQNLQTKLYFHKLVTRAVKETQNKSEN